MINSFINCCYVIDQTPGVAVRQNKTIVVIGNIVHSDNSTYYTYNIKYDMKDNHTKSGNLEEHTGHKCQEHTSTNERLKYYMTVKVKYDN